MAIVAHSPGFINVVHDAQQTFRAVLEAISRPGSIKTIEARLQSLKGFSIAGAAVCLTMLDLEVQVWLQPGFPQASRDWLLFHTGCRLTEDPKQADFAIIWDYPNAPDLNLFRSGTPEYPESATTLLMQVNSFTEGAAVTLRGPGILEQIIISPEVPPTFWQQWQVNHQRYPLGMDVLLLSNHQVLGLPRTAQVI